MSSHFYTKFLSYFKMLCGKTSMLSSCWCLTDWSISLNMWFVCMKVRVIYATRGTQLKTKIWTQSSNLAWTIKVLSVVCDLTTNSSLQFYSSVLCYVQDSLPKIRRNAAISSSLLPHTIHAKNNSFRLLSKNLSQSPLFYPSSSH